MAKETKPRSSALCSNVVIPRNPACILMELAALHAEYRTQHAHKVSTTWIGTSTVKYDCGTWTGDKTGPASSMCCMRMWRAARHLEAFSQPCTITVVRFGFSRLRLMHFSKSNLETSFRSKSLYLQSHAPSGVGAQGANARMYLSR